MSFRDRADAGQQLAVAVARLDLAAPIVLALPRGGVPVGAAVAAALDAPLEVFVAAKVAAPGHQELAVGAVAERDSAVIIGEAARHLGLGPVELERLAAPARDEVRRRAAAYRGDRPLPSLAGHDVVLVDDGLATGATAEAALHSLRAGGPSRLVLAAPVGAASTVARLALVADDVVVPLAPEHFLAVGQWYDDFGQTTDREVLQLLAAARSPGTQA